MDRFIIMTEWGDALAPLTDEQVGKVFRIMLKYNKGIEEEINDPNIQVVWNFIKPNIDRINTKYQLSVENGKKGGAPKGNQNARKTTEEQPNNNTNQPKDNTEQPNDNLKTNYKEKEKEKYNNHISSHSAYDERFTKIVNLFPSTKLNGVEDAYQYTWLWLDEEEKQTAEKMSKIYIERNQATPQYIKPIGKYFDERFWNIDKVSLDFIKNKNNSGKTYQQRVSEVIL